MKLELTPREITLIILGMTGTIYPLQFQKEAFELVQRLKSLEREKS